MSDSYTNTNARADSLNQTAAHDTGIYDPNVHDNQIVAMYETEARAQAARDALVSNGIPERAIHVTTGEQDRFAGGVDYERSNSGLWGAIKSLFMPDEEAHGYAEGVRRGHAILVVRPDATMDRHRLVELLESTEPLDFDAKLEEWRQAGYSYPGTTGADSGAVPAGATGIAIGTPTTTGVATDTSAMRATDTTPAGTFRDAPSASTYENDSVGQERLSDLPGGAYKTRTSPTIDALEGTAAMPAAVSTDLADDRQLTPAATSATTPRQDETIKLIEERLQVGKREIVKGAVRVRSYIIERPVEQQVRLRDERVEIERHPVDRPADLADDTLFRERVIEARATAEEAIIGKEARVVEEVGLRKEAIDRTEIVRDTVRKTEIEIEGAPSVAGSDRDAVRSDGTPTTTAGATTSGANAPKK